MKLSAIMLTAVLLCVFGGIHYANAVGYDSHVSGNSSEPDIKADSQNWQSFAKAVRKATFVEKFPEILDQVAGFVKDVLGQFGVRSNRNH